MVAPIGLIRKAHSDNFFVDGVFLSQVKLTILDTLVSDYSCSQKELSEGLGVTRRQWEAAQHSIAARGSGVKIQAGCGSKLKVGCKVIEEFVTSI